MAALTFARQQSLLQCTCQHWYASNSATCACRAACMLGPFFCQTSAHTCKKPEATTAWVIISSPQESGPGENNNNSNNSDNRQRQHDHVHPNNTAVTAGCCPPGGGGGRVQPISVKTQQLWFSMAHTRAAAVQHQPNTPPSQSSIRCASPFCFCSLAAQ
jgi:hypothetical protein